MEENFEYSEEYLSAWNAYFYPNTNVFKNRLNIKNYEELEKADIELSFKRLLELGDMPIVGNFDKEHLIFIHAYLFQDLYDWAGKYRTVFMGKNSSYFAEVENIDIYLEDAFDLMGKEILEVHNYYDFIRFLAKYYVILLNIHPFRDGNGRTIKEFFAEYVLEKSKEILGAEYELNWGNVDAEKLDEAMVLARTFKAPIEAELMKALVKVEEIKKESEVLN